MSCVLTVSSGDCLDTDTRPLHWNKDVFRDAGFNLRFLPRPGTNWIAYTQKITRVDDEGKFERIRYIPGYNTWLYLYAYANGAKFSVTMDVPSDAPEMVEAPHFRWTSMNACGAEKVNAYQSTFKAKLQPS